MRDVAALLKERLEEIASDDKRPGTLLSATIEVQLGELPNFLKYAKRRLPRLHNAIIKKLGEKKYVEEVGKALFPLPLHLCTNFLKYVHENVPAISVPLENGIREKDKVDNLLQKCLKAPLGELETFLRYCWVAMPDIAESLDLSLAGHCQALAHRASQTPLHLLTGFLKLLDDVVSRRTAKEGEERAPSLANCFMRELAMEDYSNELLEHANTSPLGYLQAFLAYTDKCLPELASSLRRGLEENMTVQQHKEQLVLSALSTAFGGITAFLKYARDNKMTAVLGVMNEELALEENRERLVIRALETPLGDLLGLLRESEHSIPRVWAGLRTGLERDAHQQRLAALAGKARPQTLRDFLSYADKNMPKCAEHMR